MNQHPVKRLALSLLCSIAICGTATALASSPPAPERVLEIVDALPLEGELEATVDELKEAGVTPEYLRQVLVEGRTYQDVEPGTKRVEIEDAYGRSTEVTVIVPRSYKPAKNASGVIMCLHGLGGEGDQVVDLYRSFAEDQGMLLVCPTAQPLPADRPHPDSQVMQQFPQLSSTHWWSYWSGNFPLTLLRHLSREYRLDRDRVVLSGYSMGGFGAWNIGMRFPDRFAAVLPMAGGISGLEYLGSEDRTMRSLMQNLVSIPVYFIHGDADATVPVRFDQSSNQQLDSLGSRDHVYVQVPGGAHMLDIQPSGKLMRDACKWLSKKERESKVKQFVHCALDPDHGSCRWISIDEITGGMGKVQARLKSSGKFEIVTEGVAELTVRVNESLAKMNRPVTVKLNGKTAFKGKVVPTLLDLLTTWRESEDPALLYDASISLRP